MFSSGGVYINIPSLKFPRRKLEDLFDYDCGVDESFPNVLTWKTAKMISVSTHLHAKNLVYQNSHRNSGGLPENVQNVYIIS